jgi:hypothetical protein
VGITAVAAGPNNTRFARHAILRVSAPAATPGQPAADPVTVLGWDAPGA